ncbi:MAG: tetratricopeptide repeat protein [Pirellulales bacterium]
MTSSQPARRLAAVGLLLPLAVIAGWFGFRAYQNRPAAKFARALAALQDSAPDVARRELSDWPARPADAQRRLVAGWVLLLERQYLQAVEELRGPADAPALRPLALPLYAEALYGAGLPVDSIAEQLEVLASAPDRLPTLRPLASAWFDLAAMPQAEAVLDRIQQLDPVDPRSPRLIGQIRLEGGDYPGALAALQEATRRASSLPGAPPTHPDVLLDLATCRWKLREPAEALRLLDRCPPSDRRDYLRAACLYDSDKRDDARQLVEQMLMRTPASAAAGRLAARWAREAGAPEESLQLLLSMAQQNPYDDEVHAELALAFRAVGDLPQAEKAERAVAKLTALRDEYRAQVTLFAAQPRDAQVRFRAGELARERRLLPIARWWFEAVLRLDPSHTAARQALDELGGPIRNDARAIPAAPETGNNGTQL